MSTPPKWTPLPESWRSKAWLAPGSVLLESTLPSHRQHRSLLFTSPLQELTANSPEDLPGFFCAMEQALEQGFYLAGYFTYEAGAHMQGVPAHGLAHGNPLAHLGVFREPEIFDHIASANDTAAVETAETSERQELGAPMHLAMLPDLSFPVYETALLKVLDLIGRGDTYQVNLTMPFQSSFTGSGLDLYRALAREQPCSYSALLRFDCDRAVLSFSPELFFATNADGQITTRPMKGTAPRATTCLLDQRAAQALQSDEKNRAEHVMIVDLMRNDLGRICKTGSIRVDDLFHVQPYPTLHQMVSTVSGTLRQHIRWQEVFAGLFPSGSITGAPKRRTMQIIHQLEAVPRDIYTGAIGYVAPSGESAFSVAIRTLTLQPSHGVQILSMGVGGGVVADSTARSEWNECLLKSSFVHRASEELLLIETMLLEGTPPQVRRLPLHLARLAASAFSLGFRFDEEAVRSAIQAACGNDPARTKRRMRLTLSREGVIRITLSQLDTWPASLDVIVASHRTSPENPALRYKTTFRHVYDDALRVAREQGWQESIFLNTQDEVTEGCITNLLLQKGDALYTPALACGVLPGVLRQALLQAGAVHERVLSPADLVNADAVYLCNSVRGIVPIYRLQLEPGRQVLFTADAALRRASEWMQCFGDTRAQ